MCKKCPANCKECIIENNTIKCLRCEQNEILFLFEGECIKQCKNQLFKFYNIFTSSYECKICGDIFMNCSKCILDK